MVKSLKNMTLDELSATISSYPWYAGARKRLCEVMAELGDGAWSRERFAEEALYMGSRKLIASLWVSGARSSSSEETVKEMMQQSSRREIVVVGGDYFSKEQYENVGGGDAGVFSGLAKPEPQSSTFTSEDDFSDICTETLAEIYADQGYYDKAREIYSKLILRYPEKNTYFATLIEKLDKKDTK